MRFAPRVGDDSAALASLAETVLHTVTGRGGYDVGAPFVPGRVAGAGERKNNEQNRGKTLGQHDDGLSRAEGVNAEVRGNKLMDP
jgi:hypothetical protein